MQSTTPVALEIARRYWGMSLVRGVVAIIFGLLAVFWPNLTFALFMLVFGIFAIVEGFILLGNAFSQRTVQSPVNPHVRRADPAAQEQYYAQNPEAAREQYGYAGTPAQPQARPTGTARQETHRGNRSTLMIEGILSIVCGILALILPAIIGTLALYVIAAWALFKGVGALMQTGTRGWVLGIIGILGILLALIVLFNPLRIIHSLIVIIGIFALVSGVMLVLRSLRQNARARSTRPIEPSY
ncbi:MAG TPA: DUF308 domain-containing protein [Ktedonobacteraceae bacterium]